MQNAHSSSNEQPLRRSAFSPSRVAIHAEAVGAVVVVEAVAVGGAAAVAVADVGVSATVATVQRSLATRLRLHRRRTGIRLARSANAPSNPTVARTWVCAARASLRYSRRKRRRRRGTHSRLGSSRSDIRYSCLHQTRGIRHIVSSPQCRQCSISRGVTGKNGGGLFCCSCILVNIRISILCLIHALFAL